MQSKKSNTTSALVFEEGVMPVVGYFGPYRRKDDKRGADYDYITDDIYQKIKTCGIGLISYFDHDYGNEEERQHVLDALACADKNGLFMYIRDHRIPFNASVEEVQQYLSEYNHYASFKGIQIIDEPGNDSEWSMHINNSLPHRNNMPTLSTFATMSTSINMIEGVDGFSGLLPFREWIGVENYNAYIEEYVETCKPKVINFDYYVFDPGFAVSKPGYFVNLSIIRENSLKYGIPFWPTIQAGSYWNDGAIDAPQTPNDRPTRGQLLWNVNTSLAYGAKGIHYFPLIQPYWFSWQENVTYDYERNGLIAANGEPTKWYYYAQEANRQIGEVGSILLQAESKEILAVGGVAKAETGCTLQSYGTLASIRSRNKCYGAIVGCFDYLGKEAFYVVNYMDGAEEEITLNFIENLRYQVFSTQLSEEIAMSGEGDSCTLKLVEGGAALVVVE